jgi:hypothetical protein
MAAGKHTIRLVLESWTAAIPAGWDFEVQFAPADKSFTSWGGQKFMALKGSLLRGSGPKVESLLAGIVKHKYAEEVKK